MKYEKTIIDEVSGVEVPNELYKAYLEGVKEVVEWLETKREGGYNFCVKLNWDEWRAKLEEWGL